MCPELSRVPRVIAGDSTIFGSRFGSSAGDLPFHSHNEENTYFSLFRLIHGVAKISKLIYIAWLLHDLIQNIWTFKLNTAKITQYKVGLNGWPLDSGATPTTSYPGMALFTPSLGMYISAQTVCEVIRLRKTWRETTGGWF